MIVRLYIVLGMIYGVRTILLFLVFIIGPGSVFAEQLKISSEFMELEKKTKNPLTHDRMSYLGSQSLFAAKILKIDTDSLEFIHDKSYFKLTTGEDICQQSFINGLDKYIVHTKCFRGGYVLLDYISSYKK